MQHYLVEYQAPGRVILISLYSQLEMVLSWASEEFHLGQVSGYSYYQVVRC